MLNFRSATFIKSATLKKDRPNKNLKEVLFVGRSNVGKSSLINALCDNKSLCFTSSKPGHTRLLNYFEIKDTLYLVDAPGYGYSKAGGRHDELFGAMMEDYFAENDNLSLIVFLMDSRREVREEEKDLLNFFNEENIPYVITFTKADKLNQSEKAKAMKEVHKLSSSNNADIIFTSINNKNSIEELKKYISNHI
ncbi:MAG: YihA family ribosome biogenesis GTP-binding protein [Erysipelotrichales bacterium]|nr:YihA family ribosome biogenesis GTP-binding protein [Erysipelotrichales bacterium]